MEDLRRIHHRENSKCKTPNLGTRVEAVEAFGGNQSLLVVTRINHHIENRKCRTPNLAATTEAEKPFYGN